MAEGRGIVSRKGKKLSYFEVCKLTNGLHLIVCFITSAQPTWKRIELRSKKLLFTTTMYESLHLPLWKKNYYFFATTTITSETLINSLRLFNTSFSTTLHTSIEKETITTETQKDIKFKVFFSSHYYNKILSLKQQQRLQGLSNSI
ncbi:hypothetical protein FF38_11137 [Lucilia cuprina]|uniref:Uncharacterized protein n=1 Tax=Lucilia cuprina TaxID=7375 RepID=A0A0L0BVS5_LUCCU|nr:hypothetical protein FF38_11137 [Lucilia cuprina]